MQSSWKARALHFLRRALLFFNRREGMAALLLVFLTLAAAVSYLYLRLLLYPPLAPAAELPSATSTPTPTLAETPTPIFIRVTQTRAHNWLTNTAVYLTATHLPFSSQAAYLDTQMPLMFSTANPGAGLFPQTPTLTWYLLTINTQTPIYVATRTRTPTRSLTAEPSLTLTVTATGTITPTLTPTPTATQDPRLIAFSADRNNDGGLDLAVMNADGSGVRTLVQTGGNALFLEAMMNSWSPDNSQIVFTGYGGTPFSHQLYLVPVSGASDAVLIPNLPSGENSQAAFSPNGMWIVFRNLDLNGQSDLYIIHPDGTGLAVLTDDDNDDYFPDWSPDGTRLVYASAAVGQETDLYLLDVSGGLPAAILPTPQRITFTAGAETTPHFSSTDADLLLFAGNDSGQWEIYTARLSNWNTSLRNLTNNASADTAPHWSAVSSRILFLSNRGILTEIYSMNFDGSAVQMLPNDVANEAQPRWQR